MEEQPSSSTTNHTEPEGECIEIKQFLWNTSNDLTSLPSTMSIFLVAYSLIIILGVSGNSLVIASVYRHKALQSVRNIFIVSLSFSDIIVSLVSGTVTPISAFSKVWLFGHGLCKLVPLIQGSSLCFSTFTLTAIAIDRFILIIYPTKRSIQTKHAIYMIIVNYLIATSISFPMFLKTLIQSYGNFCGVFCAEDWGNENNSRSLYGTVVFVLQFVLPVMIITVCYASISVKLAKGILVKGRNEEQNQKLTAKSDQRKAALKRRMRTNRMLVTMVLVFLICWSPAVVFNFLRDYDWLPQFVKSQEYLFGLLTHLISISSTVWNPLLLTILNSEFRLAFSEYLRPCQKGKNKAKLVCQSTNPDVESIASIGQTKTSRLSQRLSERCSNILSGVIFEVKGRNPQQAVRNTVSMSPQATNNRDSTQWTSKLIDNTTEENDVVEDSQI